MRNRGLSAATIACLKAEPETRFSDQAAWQAHLDRLGFNAFEVTPDQSGSPRRYGAAFRRMNFCAMPVDSERRAPGSSTSAGTRCAGFTRNDWSINWIRSMISTAMLRRGFAP